MKKMIYLYGVIAILSCSSTFRHITNSENQQAKYLEWRSDSKLSWSDFNGKGIDQQEGYEKYDAISWTLVKRNQTALSEDKISITVITFFIRDLSWVKKGERSNHLLSHEKLHWDIAELFTRKLRKTYSEHISESINESYKYFNKEYNKMLNEESLYQDLYDKETNYSKDKKQQKKWETKVSDLLKEYEVYSNVNVEVKRLQ